MTISEDCFEYIIVTEYVWNAQHLDMIEQRLVEVNKSLIFYPIKDYYYNDSYYKTTYYKDQHKKSTEYLVLIKLDNTTNYIEQTYDTVTVTGNIPKHWLCRLLSATVNKLNSCDKCGSMNMDINDFDSDVDVYYFKRLWYYESTDKVTIDKYEFVTQIKYANRPIQNHINHPSEMIAFVRIDEKDLILLYTRELVEIVGTLPKHWLVRVLSINE